MEEMNNTMMNNEVEETGVTTDMVPSSETDVDTAASCDELTEGSSSVSKLVFVAGVGFVALAAIGAKTAISWGAPKVVNGAKKVGGLFKSIFIEKPKEEGEPSEPVDIEVEASEVEPEENKK